MVSTTSVRHSLLDRRVLLVWALFVVWYVAGTQIPDGNLLHGVAQPIFLLTFLYMVVSGFTVGVLGGVAFWVGLGVYFYILALLLVRAADSVRGALAANPE